MLYPNVESRIQVVQIDILLYICLCIFYVEEIGSRVRLKFSHSSNERWRKCENFLLALDLFDVAACGSIAKLLYFLPMFLSSKLSDKHVGCFAWSTEHN